MDEAKKLLREMDYVELKNVKENMVNKYELDDFVEKLKASVGESLPSLPFLTNKQPQVDEVSEDIAVE